MRQGSDIGPHDRSTDNEEPGMAKSWKCARCSMVNDEAAITCSSCGLIRGGVVPDASYAPPPEPPSVHAAAAADAPPGVEPGVMTVAPESIEPGAAAPTARPFWRRIPIGLVVVAVIVLAGSVAGWYFGAGRSESGEITRAGDLTATDLRVGDCYDLKDPASVEVDNVTARPCTAEHEYQIFFVGSLPEGDYPAEETFQAFVEDNCVPAFDTFVGKAYTDSELEIFWFYPMSDAWGAGDQSVQCAVYHPRIHRLTESQQGSNR
jgi:hypothetical protein